MQKLAYRSLKRKHKMQEQEFTLAGFIAGTLRLQLTPQRDIDPQTKVIAFFNPPSRVGRMIVWVEESSTAYCELHNVGILYGEPDNDESTFLERVGFAKIGWDELVVLVEQIFSSLTN